METSKGGHQLIKLEKVVEWNNDDSVLYVNNHGDVTTRKAVEKVHRVFNHKKMENMEYA